MAEIIRENGTVKIIAGETYYRDLNNIVKDVVEKYQPQRVELREVFGQRYIATRLRQAVEVHIFGTPGNDLGAFMKGPRITVWGNAQDGCGNTMDDGEIVVHGNAGDILAMSMRGGKIFVKGDIGYRCAIHMKEYGEKKPLVVVGGTAQDFLGEYMAGGTLVLLGLTLGKKAKHEMSFIGTGMHGGSVYLRGKVDDHQLGKEVGVAAPSEDEFQFLKKAVEEFSTHFGYDAEKILSECEIVRLYPKHLRPYGRLYAY